MATTEQIRDRILSVFSDASVEVVENPGPAVQHSLRIDHNHARKIAAFLRDDAELRLDYCSNVTGVDWLEPETGFIEVVYHLYSMALKSNEPVIIRLRTANRTDDCRVPSLTPVWRSAEFQEREVYDLFGVVFTDHPDLRRILMWDEFKDHPMRRDYVEPDDYEYEPTPHDQVLTRAAERYPKSEEDVTS